jgi:hypothetical protein
MEKKERKKRWKEEGRKKERKEGRKKERKKERREDRKKSISVILDIRFWSFQKWKQIR